jgi:hypothetical protein
LVFGSGAGGVGAVLTHGGNRVRPTGGTETRR